MRSFLVVSRSLGSPTRTSPVVSFGRQSWDTACLSIMGVTWPGSASGMRTKAASSPSV